MKLNKDEIAYLSFIVEDFLDKWESFRSMRITDRKVANNRIKMLKSILEKLYEN